MKLLEKENIRIRINANSKYLAKKEWQCHDTMMNKTWPLPCSAS